MLSSVTQLRIIAAPDLLPNGHKLTAVRSTVYIDYAQYSTEILRCQYFAQTFFEITLQAFSLEILYGATADAFNIRRVICS